MKLTDLYSEKILEIAGNPPAMPRLAHPQATARRVSRVCGSVIEVDVNVADGLVSAFGYDIRACALGQTAAAIVAGHVVGATPDELRTVRTQMIAMLKADGPPPSGEKWADLKYLEPVRDYPPRHASTLLVFDAVVDGLDQIELQEAS